MFDPDSFRPLARLRFWTRLLTEVRKDDCFGMAAQLSYYLLLAFFPFLVFLSALIGFIPGWGNLVGDFVHGLEALLPESAYRLTTQTLDALLQRQDQGVLTVGLGLTLYFSSLAFYGMIGVLNRAYRVQETRALPATFGLAVLVTLLFSVFVLAANALLFFGNNLIEGMIDERLALLRLLYSLLRWTLTGVFLNFGIQLVYYLLPAHRRRWQFVSPGSLMATFGFILASLGFRAYLNSFHTYSQLYGTLGSLMALMLWFYIGSLCLLVGGVADSEIYRKRSAR